MRPSCCRTLQARQLRWPLLWPRLQQTAAQTLQALCGQRPRLLSPSFIRRSRIQRARYIAAAAAVVSLGATGMWQLLASCSGAQFHNMEPCVQVSATSAPDSELSFAGDLRTSSGSPEPHAAAVAPAAVSAAAPGSSNGRVAAGPPPAASGYAALQHPSVTVQCMCVQLGSIVQAQCKPRLCTPCVRQDAARWSIVCRVPEGALRGPPPLALASRRNRAVKP